MLYKGIERSYPGERRIVKAKVLTDDLNTTDQKDQEKVVLVMHSRPPALVGIRISVCRKKVIKTWIIDQASEMMNCQPILSSLANSAAWQIQANKIKFTKKIHRFFPKITTIVIPFVFCTAITLLEDYLLSVKDDRLHVFSLKTLKKIVSIKLNHETSYPFNISAAVHRDVFIKSAETEPASVSLAKADRKRRVFLAVLDSAQFRYPTVVVNTAWYSLIDRRAMLSNQRIINMRSTIDNSNVLVANISQQIFYDVCWWHAIEPSCVYTDGIRLLQDNSDQNNLPQLTR